MQKKRFLILTGEPGCGKTTFAEIILHKLAGLDFCAYWINKSVNEIEKLLKDDDSKQVFYFDDFLGHTRYEIENSRVEEKGLLHFLRRVTQSTNKYFILTTRTSLINSAAAESERFRNSGLFLEKNEIKVKSLNDQDKIHMINNHLDVKEVPESYTMQLTADLLLKIAQHHNFSPRLIEFVTLVQNYTQTNPSDYYNYILKQLNNPHEVWLHAYEQQLDEYDRFLITTLYSFGNAVKLSSLQCAFEERLQYEIKYNHIPRSNNAFHKSLKKLMGSYFTIKQFFEGERIEFINPSLEDFLNYYLKDNDAEKIRIANSFIFIEQIYSRFRSSGKNHLLLSPDEFFRRRILNTQFETTTDVAIEKYKSYVALYTAMINHMFFNNEEDAKSTLLFLKKVDWFLLEGVNDYHLLGFLKIAVYTKSLQTFVIENFEAIILAQFNFCQSLENIEYTKTLFDDYEQDYFAFISIKRNKDSIKRHIDFFFEDEIFNEIEDLYENAIDIQGVMETRDEIEEQITEIYETMELKDSANLQGFNDVNWEAICATNLFKEQMRKDDEEKGPILTEGNDF